MLPSVPSIDFSHFSKKNMASPRRNLSLAVAWCCWQLGRVGTWFDVEQLVQSGGLGSSMGLSSGVC